jgi:hypothetical protein
MSKQGINLCATKIKSILNCTSNGMTNLMTFLAYLGFAALMSCQSVSYIFAQTSNIDSITEVGNKTGIYETFSISGLIGSLTFDNNVTNNSSFVERNLSSSPVNYIEAGNWSLKVVDKKIRDFDVTFTMVHPDGSDWHYHAISNFRSDPDVPVLLEDDGTTFDGTVNIREDVMDRWFDVQSSVSISNLNTIVIFLDPEGTENHFNGQPIYGIVTSSLDENGNPIFSSKI